MKGKIGVGIITCDREQYLKSLIKSIDLEQNYIDHIVIVNDGSRKIDEVRDKIEVINNETNIGVGKSKNKALTFLLNKGCEYIFLIEDDLVIKDNNVFKKYIETSKATGIQHFNFGPGTPFNRKQDINDFDLHNRHLLSEVAKPLPRAIIEYNEQVKIDLFLHCAGVLSFFTRKILDEVGLFDEDYINAWEHVDHTMRIIKAKGHPPFWWFADIHDSVNYIDTHKDAIDKSTTARDPGQWQMNIIKGREIYRQKHGFYPNQCINVEKNLVLHELKDIKNKWKT